MAAPKSIPWPTTADFPPGVWMAETRKPPSTPYPLHHHRVAEITWILGGTGRLWLGGKTHPLSEGSLFAFAQGTPHQILESGSHPIHRFTLFFQVRNLPVSFQKDFKALADELAATGPSVAALDHPTLPAQFRSMLKSQSAGPGDDPLRIGRLGLLVSHILAHRRFSHPNLKNPKLRLLKDWFADPRNRIEDPDGAERSARALGLSIRQWNRLFRMLYGTSFTHWCIGKRLDRVDALMADGATAVRAAEMAGFETIPHFFRIYRKYRGHTPGQFGAA